MRNVIVTGGSRGLGLGIARRLAETGFRVIAVARKENDELASAMQEAERANPGSFHFASFDLAQIKCLANLVTTLRKDHGPIYGLVNNAGVSADGALALMPNSQIEQVVRLNTLSPIVLTKYVARAMMADGGGRIVNIASINAFAGYSGLSVYGATKASLIGFTKSLAREIGCMGVNVNAIAPGFVDTDMTQGLTDEHRQQIIRRSALKRLVDIDDIANSVEFLLSDKAKSITGTVLTVDAGSTSLNQNPKPAANNISDSTGKAWLRAMELTAPISRNPTRILPTVIEELATRFGDAPALLSSHECMTYRALSQRSNQYARWALAQGLVKGEVVGLLMANRPEYLAIWLGITSIGGVVALLNTNLVGASLAHCIDTVSPRHLIVSEELVDTTVEAMPDMGQVPAIWTHGVDHPWFRRIDVEIEGSSGESLGHEERRPVSIADRALYIYTSGTTGLPKAAIVSHARVMQWSYWFAGMMGPQRDDRIYNCLPMYHSVGGVQVPGASLVSGASLVIREKFSASKFWDDIVDWDCTMFQYIGELCRYLLNNPPTVNELKHRMRLACGNGLGRDIWESFQNRFRLPRILEFYASTEGAVSLFNVEGKPGSIGRIPSYLPHRRAVALVHCDIETGQPVRNEQGLCIPCAPNESGEAIGKLADDPGTRFEGYADEVASQRKILRDVFELGDAWVRTGDLLRKDEKGFFYFVDRIGDTFRWKGENVATIEVSEAIFAFPGVEHATVYGVTIPSTDGRVGMATLVATKELDLAGLRKHLMNRLPAYARPLFLRIRSSIDVTGTFKYSKTDLADQGYDPEPCTDYLYFDNPESQAYIPLDKQLYDLIQVGRVRL